ncbi:MAG: NRPS [Chaenotheca gracillima]|nr:MAG: NRPS [Chaenotheca gracillima]
MSTAAQLPRDPSTNAPDVRLTAFPNLFSNPATASQPHPPPTASGDTRPRDLHQWSSPELRVPEHTLLQAWAHLLHAYTGQDRLVFTLNDETVICDLEADTLDRIPSNGEAHWRDGCTGIFTSSAYPNRPYVLSLRVVSDEGRVQLVGAPDIVPADFLSQLGNQIITIIRNRTLGQDTKGPLQSDQTLSLSISNPNPRILPGPNLLHQLVGLYAGQHGCALDFLELDGSRRSYSYRSLQAQTDFLASRILRMRQECESHKLSENKIIPILLPQSTELYISIIAILKAGAAFCPLNLDAPEERVKFVIKDTSAPFLLTNRSYVDKVRYSDGPPLFLVDDEMSSDPDQLEHHFDPLEISPLSLAYVMYTSGSTGTPKGVGVSHQAAAQSLLAHREHIPEFGRFLQFAAPTFDVFVFELFFPLFRGATLVGCDRGELLSDLPAILVKLNVDAAELTPSVAGGLLKRRQNAPCLRTLLTIGEMLTQPLIDEFGGSSTKPYMLHGMYGPTEAAIHCTLATRMAAGSRPGDIGVPLATVSAYIVRPIPEAGDQVQPGVEIMPLGQIGELAVGGHQLADGYLNRPEQTSGAFVDLPGYGLIYRTGDKARIFPDGRIECLGRIVSGQVKLRGQRVELGEVEDVVSRVAGVDLVMASVLAGTLIAFCAADEGVASSDILKLCKRWLPAFMIPGDVLLHKEFPRLPSGKIDRKRLESEYLFAKEETRSAPDEFESDTERTVDSTIVNLLGVHVGRKQSLAAVGLDSLMAIRLAAKLRDTGFQLGAVDVLKADCIQEIALAVVEKTQPEAGLITAHPPQPSPSTKEQAMASLQQRSLHTNVDTLVSCSPSQVAMLTETMVNGQAYCNWIELQMSSGLDLDQIHSAWKELLQKHEILRSGFIAAEESEEAFLQIVWKHLPSTQMIEVQDFSFDFSINDHDSLLWPLKIQIMSTEGAWRIIVQLHHALYDGWSWEHCMRDLNAALNQRSIPERSPYWLVTNAYLHQDPSDLEASKDYWQEHLRDAPPSTLPNFHGRVGVPTGLEVLHHDCTFDHARLTSRAQELGVSAQTFFQGAFSYILSCYLGSPDLIFGSVCSGRTLPVPGIEDIIGPCVTTLPTRVDLSVLRTFQDLLQNLQNLNRQMLEHCMVPLRDIKKSANFSPTTPLFDTLLVWQQTLQASGSDSEDEDLIYQTASADYLEFNLTLEIEPSEDGVHIKANYQRSVLPSEQVTMLVRQVDHLVSVLIENESMTIEEAPQYFESSLLSVGNPKPDVCVGTDRLSTAVERAAHDEPDRPAIDFTTFVDATTIETKSLTYQELNERANRIAHCLQDRGVRQNDIVCVCMEKSLDLYVSILAIVKAGAGYLPLVPETPPSRLQHILEEAKVGVCVVSSAVAGEISVPDRVSILNVDETDFASFDSENIQLPFRPSDLAYAVFTSGSTGVPKGVLVTQGNLLSNLNVLSDLYPTESGSRLLQACSQAFDVSVFEIFFSWHVGMCLCSATKDILFRDLENAIRKMRITHLSLTPTVAALVDPGNVRDVHFMVTAGEGVTQKVFDSWADNGLYQGYGPSETTNICTVNPKVSASDAINNLGPPFVNTSAFVITDSPDFTPVIQGGVGEFCFGGDQVFRGYLNRPELNAEKIFDHPEHGRLYRSGDYGRLLSNGSLIFTGRQDDQVKIRGQRVELGEINAILLQEDLVEDSFTLLTNQTSGASQQLVSFWVPLGPRSSKSSFVDASTDLRKTIDDLYSNLSSAVPAYMIPSALVPVTSLPRTEQGKIDKKKLISTFHAASVEYLNSISMSFEVDVRDDWTTSELELAEILAKVLHVQVSTVQRNTSFFSLGLDSISAIAFARSITTSRSVNVDVSMILKNSTISKLSKLLENLVTQNATPANPLLDLSECFEAAWVNQTKQQFARESKAVEDILPCTPLQEAMIAVSTSNPDSAYYNHTLLQIKGDLARLRQAWSAMSRHHSILRTCFVQSDSLAFPFAQVVISRHEPAWRIVEVSSEVLRSAPEQHMKEIAGSHGEREPPYQLTVFLAPEKTVMMLSMHHALYDGAAISQLLYELECSYHGEGLAPPVSFKAFLESALALNASDADKFWKKTLKDVKPSLLNLKAKTREDSWIRTINLRSKMSLSDLENHSRKLSSTLLAIGHAAWARLLCVCLDTNDVCFGNVVSGRSAPIEGVERLVAPCFNTIPVRAKLPPNADNKMLLRDLQELNSDSLPFQFTPLRWIQSKFGPPGSRLFDSLFILQQTPTKLDGRIWETLGDYGEMDEDLETILESYDAILRSTLSYPAARTLDLEFLGDRLKSIMKNYHEEEPSESLQASPQDRTNTIESGDEKLVRHTIATLAGITASRIRKDTTIFQLGLDSINAVQIAKALRDKGKNVSAATVLENPSIGQLAQYVQASTSQISIRKSSFDFVAFDRTHRNRLCSKLRLRSSEVEIIRPCSPIQSGMIAQFLHSQGTWYFNHVVMQLDSALDLAKLKLAWLAVCKKHQMLRTGFVQTDNAEHPFAMVTFNEGVTELPWAQKRLENSRVWDEITKCKTSQASEVLTSLERPPWRLTALETGKETILQFSAHHALYDAHSLQLIFSDVISSYSDSALSDPRPIEPLLEATLCANPSNVDRSAQFWKEKRSELFIAHFPNLTPLRVQSSQNLAAERLSSRSRSSIEQGCQSGGITMQAAVQAAWARVLSAYVGENSVTFGIVFSGRSTEDGAESVAFPSVTTIPAPCLVDGSNEALTRQMMELNVGLRRHQFTPLRKIQQYTGHPQESLFDTILAYQKTSRDKEASRELWTVIDEDASVEYVLSMEIEHDADRDALAFRLTFKDDHVPREQASIILEQFDATLVDTIFSPQLLCKNVSRISKGMLSHTPPKDPAIPSEILLLHKFVEQQAVMNPRKIALEFATDLLDSRTSKSQWTYAQLDNEGNKIAHLLQDHRIRPASFVGVCFDKCPEASFAMLGILKAGCAFVALDPGAPMDRRKFIVEDSKSMAVLTTMKLAEEMQGVVHVPVIQVDDQTIMKELESSYPESSHEVQPNDTCYCLYTSGTTGTPKGCELTHENAVQAIVSFQRLFAGHWNQDSRFLQFASFHFDVSVLEQYWSWSVGICCTSAPRDLILQDIAETIRQLKITHIDLTPSLARILHPDDVPSLWPGVFITGGEALKQEIIDIWGPKECIYNGYGPTEATIGVTMFTRVPVNGKPSNIGRQFDNVGTYVLAPRSTDPVLRGGVGELCISGKLVGRGYLSRPELTAKAFPNHPEFGERIYRTGDLVRLLHDGTFEFLGRADDQVKLRGQRLEIGEINQVIRVAVPGIAEVSTLVVKHTQQQKEQLVSFVVAEELADRKSEPVARTGPSARALVMSIRQMCESKLPGYMIPTHIIPISSMPLSVNNKADLKWLKEMYNSLSLEDLKGLSQDDGDSQIEWQQDQITIRKALASSTGLEIESISKNSNVFQLGLDSISVIGFCNLLRREGFPNIQTSLVFKNPTVAGLAQDIKSDTQGISLVHQAQVAAHQKIAAFSHQYKIVAAKELQLPMAAIESVAPCTALQEGMFSRSLGQEKPVYFESFHFELASDVDLGRLRQAWDGATRKSQILRTHFVPTADGMAQVVTKERAVPWTISTKGVHESIEELTKSAYKKWWRQNQHQIKNPFELQIIICENSTFMILNILHALYDGISLPRLLNNVTEEYLGYPNSDYGPEFHKALACGPLLENPDARDFWTRHLHGASSSALPRLAKNPSTEDCVASLTIKGLSCLETVRKQLQTTHQGLVQACWAAVLHRFLGFSMTFGMVVSGRSGDFEGLEKVIGPLFNTIPFHLDIEATESWRSIVSKCHEFNIAAMPHQYTPLRDISKWCKRSPAEPFFDTLLVFQREQQDAMESQICKIWKPIETDSQADYPLAIEVQQELDGSLHCTLVAAAGYSDSTTLRKLLQAFDLALRQMVSNVDLSIFGDNMEQALPNGHSASKPVAMNANSLSHGSSKTFSWTEDAYILRDEIASLADVNVSEIQGQTSIFELGLDSIDAIKLSSRLRNKTFNLAVSTIMRNPSIDKMAKLLKKLAPKERNNDEKDHFSVSKNQLEHHVRTRYSQLKDIEEVLPVTPLQESMIAEMRRSNFTHYFNHDILRLNSGTNLAKLKDSWADVFSHTPILRACFLEIEDPEIPATYAQAIRKHSHLPWKIKRSKVDGSVQDYLDQIRDEFARCLPDVPPIQLTVFEEPQETFLILSLSHAMYDGWSLGLLHTDVDSAYRGCCAARPSFIPTLRSILGSAGADASNFWRDSLENVRFTKFPSLNPGLVRPGVQTNRQERRSRNPAADLRSFCKAHGTTLNALGQASWSCVLAYYLKSLEVVFGTVLSGRDSGEASELLFPTMNTVPVRSIIHGSRKEMLRYTQETLANIAHHQHFPLRKAQHFAAPAGTTLFDTLFIYQSRPKDPIEDEHVLYQSIGGESEVEYRLCVELEIEKSAVIWRGASDTSTFDDHGLQDLLGEVDLVLSNIIQSPNAPVMQISHDNISICELPTFTSNSETPTTNGAHVSQVHDDSSSEEWTGSQSTIRQVLATVSKVSEGDITRSSSIFHLGLDSISAIKVSSLLRKESINVGVSDIMRAATVEGIARQASQTTQGSTTTIDECRRALSKRMRTLDVGGLLESSGINPATVERILPATSGQIYLLNMWQRSSGAIFYPTFKYSSASQLSPEKLQRAWKKLSQQYPILRTTFVVTTDEQFPFLQVILRQIQESPIWCSEAPPVTSNGISEVPKPLVQLFAQTTEHGTSLALRIHHALYDAVSLPLLIKNLEDIYNGVSTASTSSAAFEDLIAYENVSELRRKRQEFWTSYLADCDSAQSLGTNGAVGDLTQRTETYLPEVVPVARRLESFARREGLSVQSVFLAAFSRAYALMDSRASPGPDVESQLSNLSLVIGIYLANRSHPVIQDLSRAPFPTLNLVPLRIDNPVGTDMISAAHGIQRDLQKISSAENIGVSLSEIHNWTGVSVNCFVNFLSLPDEEDDWQRTATSTEDSVEGSGLISILDVDEDSQRRRSEVQDRGLEHWRDPPALRDNRFKDAYLPALDIEATVAAGALDVGCFAPSSLLGPESSVKLIEKLKSELEMCLALHLRLLFWTCPAECDYTCQHIITAKRVAQYPPIADPVVQYHGKWPFHRILGVQEPFSVLFSLFNFLAHLNGLSELNRSLPARYPLAPYYRFFAYFGLVSWVCSMIFHTRDFDVTEKADYLAAGASVMYGLYYTPIRIFRLDQPATTASHSRGPSPILRPWTYLCIALYVAHALYLTCWNWDYTYNMAANVIIGIIHNLMWSWFSFARYSKIRKSWTAWPGLIVAWVVMAMSLELLDFAPLGGHIDAHSLWHAGTVIPTVWWYGFLVRDAKQDVRGERLKA